MIYIYIYILKKSACQQMTNAYERSNERNNDPTDHCKRRETNRPDIHSPTQHDSLSHSPDSLTRPLPTAHTHLGNENAYERSLQKKRNKPTERHHLETLTLTLTLTRPDITLGMKMRRTFLGRVAVLAIAVSVGWVGVAVVRTSR